MPALFYFCVFTFGTEFSDEYDLRGLFSKREDAEEFTASLDDLPKPIVVRMPHGQIVEEIATNYIRRGRDVLATKRAHKAATR